jgi:hypothetical protein
MAKKKQVRRVRKRQERISLSEEEQTQLQMLLDRVLSQDSEGERFNQFLEGLKPLVQRSVPITLAFIETLGAKASPVAVRVLQALQGFPAEKSVRRALKTALYKLGRQGLVNEQKETAVEPRVLVPRPAERQAQAWASWPESRGERGMLISLPDSGRGFLAAVAVVNPEGIFHEFDAFQTTRKGVRTLLEQMTGGVEGRLLEIPAAHLLFLIEEVEDNYRRQSRELPSGYEVIHKNLASYVQEPKEPHIYNLLSREEIAGDILLLRSSDSLFDDPALASWRLADEVVHPFAEKIKGLGQSRLVVSQSTQVERAGQIYREAAVEIFTPEFRQRYRRHLEEAALLLYLQDRQQEAKRALAVAIDLEKEVSVLTEDTFILGLVKRSIALEVGAESEGAEGEVSREKTTESGLIIP